ncbi:MAG: A/G-specific adenine glycosylase [Robiginitomaculum sp.]|nr:MAG: A/G-specific adenine glycosylase [Robiginitomaculum sp.]
MNRQQVTKLRQSLLDWYDVQGRELPWRIRPEDRAVGVIANPYPIWLSEIMCQQTRIQTVIPYHAKFIARWPDVQALAAASQDEVYGQWAGLGYYARARNLHNCARQIAAAGQFPDHEQGWLDLPGIGPYTAAAMMAILYDVPTNVVDGNVERVMARLFAVQNPLPGAKPELRKLAHSLITDQRSGDYAQAIMDLGALVCTPKSPKCGTCPWMKSCAAHEKGNPGQFPLRTAKPPRPERFGMVFVLQNENQILLQKRPEKGLLGGMSQVPGTPWNDRIWTVAEAHAFAPCAGDWQKMGEIRHVFTHFSLNVQVMHLQVGDRLNPSDGWWAQIDRLGQAALPSLYKKVLGLCL